MAKFVDPGAPKPEGAVISPCRGESLRPSQTLPSTMEAALQRYGSAMHRSAVATVLDQSGRPGSTLTYGKLLSRSLKVAHAILNKLQPPLKSGDRAALIYPNNDPLAFMVAFHACLMAGVAPVPIEVPLSKRDAGVAQLGFLLGSCDVRVALTSEACLKGLPKIGVLDGHSGSSGDSVELKGWPKLQWFVTEHLARPPKDWLPPARPNDDNPAYIEVLEKSKCFVTLARG